MEFDSHQLESCRSPVWTSGDVKYVFNSSVGVEKGLGLSVNIKLVNCGDKTYACWRRHSGALNLQ